MFKEKYREAARIRYATNVEYRNRVKELARKRYYEKIRNLSGKQHGLSRTRTWKAWHNMRQRVECKTNRDYERYKNYSIDPRWNDFKVFFSDMGVCPEGMTLDRTNNLLGYSKENCRWANNTIQARNRSTVKLSENKVINIKKMLGLVPNFLLADEYGVSQSTICDIAHGRTWKEVSYV